MPQYVDGFIIPVPKKKLDAYRRMAEEAGKVWREYWALEFRECVADDVKVGKLTSFPRVCRHEIGPARRILPISGGTPIAATGAPSAEHVPVACVAVWPAPCCPP